MNENTFAYSGADNLPYMLEAPNYNRALVDAILKPLNAIGGPDRKAVSVLDFGAGMGYIAERVSQGYGGSVLCVEPDEALRGGIEKRGLRAVVSLDEVPPNSMDYIYSLNVLEHIDDDQAALKSLYRRLKPGGRIYLFVPAFQILFSTMDVKVGHKRRYRISDLVSKMKAAGFEVEKARYADCAGFFVTLLYKAASLFRFNRIRSGGVYKGSVGLFDTFIFPMNFALDPLTGRFLGKNVEILARKR